MRRRASVRVTAAFEANLDRIEAFCIDRGTIEVYSRFLEDFDSSVIGVLERHPAIGRPFLARIPRSVEAHDLRSEIAGMAGVVDIREFLAGDYLILYAIVVEDGDQVVHLLAIRHQLELSFQFPAFWADNRPLP